MVRCAVLRVFVFTIIIILIVLRMGIPCAFSFVLGVIVLPSLSSVMVDLFVASVLVAFSLGILLTTYVEQERRGSGEEKPKRKGKTKQRNEWMRKDSIRMSKSYNFQHHSSSWLLSGSPSLLAYKERRGSGEEKQRSETQHVTIFNIPLPLMV